MLTKRLFSRRALLQFAICAAAVALLVPPPAHAGNSWTKQDPNADLSRLRTYRWREIDRIENESTTNRIRAAVDEVLAGKELRRVGDSETPDLWIEHHVGAADSIFVDTVVVGAWWGGWTGFAFTGGLRSNLEAGLLIVFSEAATDKAVWAGAVRLRGNRSDALQVMQGRAGKEAAKIVKKYPALKK